MCIRDSNNNNNGDDDDDDDDDGGDNNNNADTTTTNGKGKERARGEGGVIAEVGAHIEKGHAVAAGGLEKTGLRFFVHAKMQGTADDGIGGVEHDRGAVDFVLLG